MRFTRREVIRDGEDRIRQNWLPDHMTHRESNFIQQIL